MRRASRRTLAGAAIGALLFCVVGSPVASAESGDDARTIAAARSAIADLQLDAALAIAAPLLSAPDPRTRLAALAVSAIAHLLSGDAARGEAELADLYAIAPAYTLEDPSLPPRVTVPFEAEATRAHPRAIAISLRADDSEAGAFRLSTSLRAEQVAVACRTAPSLTYHLVATVAEPSGTFRFVLPTLRSYECYATALDGEALPLGSLGTRAAPFSAAPHLIATPIPAAKRDGVTSSWWFWGSIGVGVAAAVVAAVVVVESRSQSSPPPADLTVPAHGASLSW